MRSMRSDRHCVSSGQVHIPGGDPREGEAMAEASSPRPSLPIADPHDLPATSDERREAGRVARRGAPRATMGDWEEGERGHDGLKTILAQNHIRIPDLVPLRHQRMAASPWN